MSSLRSETYTLAKPLDFYLKNDVIEAASFKKYEFITQTLFCANSPGTKTGANVGLPSLTPGKNPYKMVLGFCNVARVIQKGSSCKLNTGECIHTF